MISVAALLAWSALVAALTLAPGPDTMLVAGHSARGGVRAGLLAVAGTTCGGVVYAALFGLGLLRLISATPALFMAVKIAGAIYLAWIGGQMLWGAVTRTPAAPVVRPALTPGAPFRQGFLTNALNPKIAIFYLAALPQFASGPNAPMIGAVLIAIHYTMGAAWLAGVALAAARAGAVLRNHPVTRWVEGAAGAFFLAVAGRLAIEQR